MARKFKLLEIKWDDASFDDGWEADKDKEELTPQVAISVGFLIRETKDHLLLASTHDEEGSTNGRFQIPKKMIINRKEIK